MPKRTSAAIAAVAAVLALTLTGCAGAPATPADEPTAPATVESSTSPTPTSAPSGPVEVSTAPTTTPDNAAEANRLIGETTRWLAGKGITLTEDQVRAAADYGCDQLEAGVDRSSVQPLTGDVAPEIVEVFMNGLDYYCPVR